jgi:hypothetical protein
MANIENDFQASSPQEWNEVTLHQGLDKLESEIKDIRNSKVRKIFDERIKKMRDQIDYIENDYSQYKHMDFLIQNLAGSIKTLTQWNPFPESVQKEVDALTDLRNKFLCLRNQLLEPEESPIESRKCTIAIQEINNLISQVIEKKDLPTLAEDKKALENIFSLIKTRNNIEMHRDIPGELAEKKAMVQLDENIRKLSKYYSSGYNDPTIASVRKEFYIVNDQLEDALSPNNIENDAEILTSIKTQRINLKNMITELIELSELSKQVRELSKYFDRLYADAHIMPLNSAIDKLRNQIDSTRQREKANAINSDNIHASQKTLEVAKKGRIALAGKIATLIKENKPAPHFVHEESPILPLQELTVPAVTELKTAQYLQTEQSAIFELKDKFDEVSAYPHFFQEDVQNEIYDKITRLEKQFARAKELQIASRRVAALKKVSESRIKLQEEINQLIDKYRQPNESEKQ